jgi:hypothetical protein
MNLALGSIYS